MLATPTIAKAGRRYATRQWTGMWALFVGKGMKITVVRDGADIVALMLE